MRLSVSLVLTTAAALNEDFRLEIVADALDIVAHAIAVFLGREPGNSEFADVNPIARAGSLDVFLQGLVGDFYHFVEVVVRLPLARARVSVAKVVVLSAHVCRLLNTAAVDARFRRISGSVSVSTKALRDLPLPAAADVRKFFSQRGRSDDEAVVAAYAASAVRKRATPTRTKPRNLSRKRRLL